MFDFGFSELMVIGAVALVVLGPERLPMVARTAGEWLGKAQRLVQQVKSDIEREAELSELKKIQQEAQNVADDLNKTVKGQVNQINSDECRIDRPSRIRQAEQKGPVQASGHKRLHAGTTLCSCPGPSRAHGSHQPSAMMFTFL